MKWILILILFLLTTQIASQTLTDADGNSYKIVKIGSQWWMAENLRTTKFNDGTPIRTETDSLIWLTIEEPAYCWYKNNPTVYKPTYGALYNWYTTQSDKICPKGWRMPTDTDFYDLIKFLDPTANMPVLISEIAGGMLKDTNWPPYLDVVASNSSGFSAVGAGCRGWSGWYNSAPYFGYFWTSTKWTVALRWATNRVFMNDGTSKYVGISIRCISTTDPPLLITNPIIVI